MIPIDQNIFYAEDQDGNVIEKGNCRTACVASILEIPLAEVPYFVAFPDWEKEQARFLAERGLHAKWSYGYGHSKPEGYSIAVGISPRSRKDKPLYHAVVALDGEIVHDPHPDRAGICGEVMYFHRLAPLPLAESV